MQEGYIQHAEGLSRCADVEQGYISMDGRRSEARVNFKRDSSSWKDEMRKGRHKDADKCPNQLWVGLRQETWSGRVAQQPRRGLRRGGCQTASPSFPSVQLARAHGPRARRRLCPTHGRGVQGTQAASRMTPAASAILRGSGRGVRWPPIRCSRRCLRPTVAILETSTSRRGLADGPGSGYLAGLRY